MSVPSKRSQLRRALAGVMVFIAVSVAPSDSARKRPPPAPKF